MDCRIIAYCSIVAGATLTACTPAGTSITELTTNEMLRCELYDTIVATGGQPNTTVNISDVSPFALVRLNDSSVGTGFGYGSPSGNTIGVGTRRGDGSWSVSGWRADPERGGPDVSLLSLFPNGDVLVSFWTGNGSHTTYAAQCRKQ
ncbi:hypothetical protein SAMN05443635_102138 [Roseobacter denitrificans OCh 114]|nr:hypothetical protein SAMN05443635_102138 [Roseobacter denitrificans OCh 114]